MIGESGSGKTTLAKSLLNKDTIRVNRDSIRKMLFEKWNGKFEPLVEQTEKHAAAEALNLGFNVIVDDLNINTRVVNSWQQFASVYQAKLLINKLDTPLDVCIHRDRYREGRDRVGESVIVKQFIRNGRLHVFDNEPTIIVDIDGTLANHEGVRSPYDESKVGLDKVYTNIVDKVCKYILSHQIIIVSGRHESCGPDTEDWLRNVACVPYHRLIMRDRGDDRSDEIAKKELLDLILKYVSKENIELVIDDRPRIIKMWRANGLEVFAARGEDLPDF